VVQPLISQYYSSITFVEIHQLNSGLLSDKFIIGYGEAKDFMGMEEMKKVKGFKIMNR